MTSSPWPSQFGDFQSRNYSPYSGPKSGTVTAQCTFENGLYYVPLINSRGEIIVALKDSIAKLDRKLNKIWEHPLCSPRTLTLLNDRTLLIGCNDGIACLYENNILKTIPLPEEFKKSSLTPFVYMVEGPDEKLYTLTGDAIFCLDLSEEINVLWSENLASRFGLFGGWRMAITQNGGVFVSGAFSWLGEDGCNEYAGYLGALSSRGEFLWQKNHELDSLPTSTGMTMRLTTSLNEIWLSDSGAVSYDFEGKELWRSEDEEGTTQLYVGTPGNEIIYAEKQELKIVSEQESFTPRVLLTLRGWPHEICLDRDNVLYNISTEGLEAWELSGKPLFQIKGLTGDKIVLGDEFLLVSSRRGRISLIE